MQNAAENFASELPLAMSKIRAVTALRSLRAYKLEPTLIVRNACLLPFEIVGLPARPLGNGN